MNETYNAIIIHHINIACRTVCRTSDGSLSPRDYLSSDIVIKIQSLILTRLLSVSKARYETYKLAHKSLPFNYIFTYKFETHVFKLTSVISWAT
jgi:hypothetical protein